ncbi:hypothetical protein BLNAU_13476 [Blattamonas nauphoetae]|uniref:Uncharacterized protein n=1 Tax=Blattamonas nauphoetae TaxID=2049346 RepID=A0ABQ9XGK2_9EUKA|nr:hypothetical protein BLNAU_13476 [Blattamonas nauphoetae]
MPPQIPLVVWQHVPPNFVTCVAIIPKGPEMITGSSTGMVTRWRQDLFTPDSSSLKASQVFVPSTCSPCLSLCFCENHARSFIVAAFDNRDIYIWDLSDGSLFSCFPFNFMKPLHLLSLPTGNVAVSGQSKDIVIFDPFFQKVVCICQGHQKQIRSMCLSNQTSTCELVSYGIDGTIISHPIESPLLAVEEMFPVHYPNSIFPIPFADIEEFTNNKLIQKSQEPPRAISTTTPTSIPRSTSFNRTISSQRINSATNMSSHPSYLSFYPLPHLYAFSLQTLFHRTSSFSPMGNATSPTPHNDPHTSSIPRPFSDFDGHLFSSQSGRYLLLVTRRLAVICSGTTNAALASIPFPTNEILAQAAQSAVVQNRSYEKWRKAKLKGREFKDGDARTDFLEMMSFPIPSKGPLTKSTPKLDPNDGWAGGAIIGNDTVILWTHHPIFFVFNLVESPQPTTPVADEIVMGNTHDSSRRVASSALTIALHLVDCTVLTKYPHFYNKNTSRFGFGSFTSETQYELCSRLPIAMLPNGQLFYFSPHPETPTLHTGQFMRRDAIIEPDSSQPPPLHPLLHSQCYIPHAQSTFSSSFSSCSSSWKRECYLGEGTKSTSPYQHLHHHPSIPSLFTVGLSTPSLTFTPFPSYKHQPLPPPPKPRVIVTSIFIPPAYPHFIFTGEYTLPSAKSAQEETIEENSVLMRVWIYPFNVLVFTSSAHSSPITFFSSPSLEDIEVEMFSAKDDDTRERLQKRRQLVLHNILNTLVENEEKKDMSKVTDVENMTIDSTIKDDIDLLPLLSAAEIELLRLMSTSESVSLKKLLKQVPASVLKTIAAQTDEHRDFTVDNSDSFNTVFTGEEPDADVFTLSSMVASVSQDNTVCVFDLTTFTVLFIIPPHYPLHPSVPFSIMSLEWNALAHILVINSHSTVTDSPLPVPSADFGAPLMAYPSLVPSEPPADISSQLFIDIPTLLPQTSSSHRSVLVDGTLPLFDDAIFFGSESSPVFLNHCSTLAPTHNHHPLSLLVPNTISALPKSILNSLPSSQSVFVDHGYTISDHFVTKHNLPPLPFYGDAGLNLSLKLISSIVSSFSTEFDKRNENDAAFHNNYMPLSTSTLSAQDGAYLFAGTVLSSPITTSSSVNEETKHTPVSSLFFSSPTTIPPTAPNGLLHSTATLTSTSPSSVNVSDVFIAPRPRVGESSLPEITVSPTISPSTPVSPSVSPVITPHMNQSTSDTADTTTLIDLQTGMMIQQGPTRTIRRVLDALTAASSLSDTDIRSQQHQYTTFSDPTQDSLFRINSATSFPFTAESEKALSDNPNLVNVISQAKDQPNGQALSRLVSFRKHEIFPLTHDDLPIVDHILKKGFVHFNPPEHNDETAGLNSDALSIFFQPLHHIEKLTNDQKEVKFHEYFLKSILKHQQHTDLRHPRTFLVVRSNQTTFSTFLCLSVSRLPPIRRISNPSYLSQKAKPNSTFYHVFQSQHASPNLRKVSLGLPHSTSAPLPDESKMLHKHWNTHNILPIPKTVPFELFHYVLPAFSFSDRSSLPTLTLSVESMLSTVADSISLSHGGHRISIGLNHLENVHCGHPDGSPFLFAPSLASFETQLKMASTTMLDEGETMACILLSLVPLLLPFGLSEEQDKQLLHFLNLPNPPLIQHGFILSPPSAHSITLTLPSSSFGVHAYTHASTLSSILFFTVLSLLYVLKIARQFVDPDLKSEWKTFMQNEATAVAELVKSSARFSNVRMSWTALDELLVPPSISYLCTLIPSIHHTHRYSVVNPVARNTFTVSHALNFALSVLLQILLTGMGKPTTHRLADTCNMLLTRETGQQKGVSLTKSKMKDDDETIVTLTTDLDMIAPFVVNLLAKMDSTVISPGLIQRLTMTLRKSVYRISKMKEMEREEADEDGPSEDEEAAGIMSLALLKDGISVFLPYLEDLAKMIKRLLHLSLDTCIVFSYNHDQSSQMTETDSPISFSNNPSLASIAATQTLIALGHTSPHLFLATFLSFLGDVNRHDEAILRQLTLVLVEWFKGFTVAVSFISELPTLFSIVCTLWVSHSSLPTRPHSKLFSPIGQQPDVADSLTVLIQLLRSKYPMTAFCESTQQLAAGLHDGTIQVWTLTKTQSERVLTASSSPIESLCFSEDGQHLASYASGENAVRVWMVKRNTFLGKLRGTHSRQVYTIKGMKEEKVAQFRKSSLVWIERTIRLFRAQALFGDMGAGDGTLTHHKDNIYSIVLD